MKNKTILGSWCSEPNCKFIDDKHIQIELLAHIWYSYDNDSKTDVINKKLCFVKEIGFNELNYEVEIIEEDKEIEKLENEIEFYSYSKYEELKNDVDKILYILKAINLTENKISNLNNKLNEIIDKVNSLENKQ